KTGTLTEGVFRVQTAVIPDGVDRSMILQWTNALESHSTHPVATAIRDYVGPVNETLQLERIEEIAGHGLHALADGKQLVVGNFKLLDRFGIAHQIDRDTVTDTVVAIGYDGRFAGYLIIADEIKKDAADAIHQLKALGITPTLLSGDRSAVVQAVAGKLGIANAYGDLLPADKASKLTEM